VRIIGIDTSLRSSGVGLIDVEGSALRLVEAMTLAMPAKLSHAQCLCGIDRELTALIAQHRPDVAAIEGIFFCRNVKTALTLGEARGVVIAACARAGLPVYEYSPRRVKQALVGHGAAEKDQVARMVIRLLGLKETPQEDSADALAIAICHAHAHSTIAALAPKPL
jgi:crossover junction endodeoxyribonuclease RuvC